MPAAAALVSQSRALPVQPGWDLITTFDVVPNGRNGTRAAAPTSVTFNYALTRAAETRIYIRDAGGHTVRTLVTSTRAADGNTAVGSAVWDLRDQKREPEDN